VGGDVGRPYEREEIEALRIWHRIERRRFNDATELKAYQRAGEIFDAWKPWQAALAKENARTRRAKAEEVYYQAADAHDRLRERVMSTRPKSLEGILAKVKAGAGMLPTEKGFDERIDEGIKRYDADDEVVAYSLTRDLLALAGLSGRV
jgi:hypothetical protein